VDRTAEELLTGDIDLIITKENASLEYIRTMLVDTVIPRLYEQGFLKVGLATSSSRSGDHGSKWHGACALPGSPIWRRIDLLFVPWDEYGAALIYFTGNDIFNRSLRLLASRKKMRLNQHGLYGDVMRGEKRERITQGKLLEGRSEERIFEILGVPWRPPEHRIC
jgi:DNA polymerase IV